MTSEFKAGQYMVELGLASSDGKLVASAQQLSNPAWSLGPYASDEMMMILITLLHFFDEKGSMQENLRFSLEMTDNGIYWNVRIDEIDRRFDYAHPSFDWSVVVDVVEFLVPHMAGSNRSYLAGNLFCDE